MGGWTAEGGVQRPPDDEGREDWLYDGEGVGGRGDNAIGFADSVGSRKVTCFLGFTSTGRGVDETAFGLVGRAIVGIESELGGVLGSQ